MYINFWYVAGQSKDIVGGADRPFKSAMLGHRFALWRDGDGHVRCISNTCSHRGASLGDARIRGNCIECPYHGWTFDGDGSCTRLPSLGSDARIPERTRIDAYPVQEKYGLVWVFLGDLPEEERPPIIEIPEYGDPKWHCITASADWKIDYKRSIENTIDPAHNEFTHPTHGFLGVRDDYRVADFEIEEHGWGNGFVIPMQSPVLAEEQMRKASNRGEGLSTGGSGHHGPNCTRTIIHVGDMWMHNYLLHTPMDESNDRWYVVVCRNAMLDGKYDKTMADRTFYIANQDRDVLENGATGFGTDRPWGTEPLLTPRDQTHEFFMPADKCIARYRQFCREWEERGWRIDVRRLRTDRDFVTYAIPSPARRKSRNWVLPAVPLLPGRDGAR